MFPLLDGVLKRRVPAGPTTLVLDQFTDTNGTALTSHTIAPTNTPATSWTIHQGTLSIQSNQCNIDTRAPGAITTFDAGVADCTVTVEATTGAIALESNMGMAFRYQDLTHYWLQRIRAFTNLHELYENNAGFTLRASAAFTVATSTTYALKTILSGTSITCRVDDGTELTYSSSVFQSLTRHGVRDGFDGGGSGVTRYDNFKVTVP